MISTRGVHVPTVPNVSGVVWGYYAATVVVSPHQQWWCVGCVRVVVSMRGVWAWAWAGVGLRGAPYDFPEARVPQGVGSPWATVGTRKPPDPSRSEGFGRFPIGN